MAMSAVVLQTPTEVASYSPHAFPPPKKPSKRKLAKRRPSPVLAGDKPIGPKKSLSHQKRPASPIVATKIIRTNVQKSVSRDLVMEEVRILKRGEAMQTLSPPVSSGDSLESLIPDLTDSLESVRKILPKSSLSAYAGPAYIWSPSPSSLPIPLFLKKAVSKGEDLAARGFLCLLRLDASL